MISQEVKVYAASAWRTKGGKYECPECGKIRPNLFAFIRCVRKHGHDVIPARRFYVLTEKLSKEKKKADPRGFAF